MEWLWAVATALQRTDEDPGIHLACIHGNVPKLLDYYLKEPVRFALNVNRPVCRIGLTPLHLAVCASHIPVVKFFISHGADIEFPDRKGQTALFRAVYEGNLECVNLLLEAGASPNGSDINITTPVFISMSHSKFCEAQLEIFKQLLRYGGIFEHGETFTLRCSLCEIFLAKPAYHAFFLQLYYDFGGRLYQCKCGQQYFEKKVRKDMIEELTKIMSTPVSLKSICRLTIMKKMGFKVDKINELPLPQTLISFLKLEE